MAAPVWLKRVCRRPGSRLDQRGQSVNVSGFELSQFAIFEDFAGQFVEQGELVENVGGGGARTSPAALGGRSEVHLVKKDFRQLRRRIDIEFVAGQLPDAALQGANLAFHGHRHRGERGGIDANSVAFHGREDGSERQVDVVVNRDEILFFDFAAKQRSQALEEIGMLARGAGEGEIQMTQGHFGEVVLRGGGPKEKGIEHDRVIYTAQRAGQKLDELRIVDDFGAPRIGEKRAQGLNDFRPGVAPGRPRHAGRRAIARIRRRALRSLRSRGRRSRA